MTVALSLAAALAPAAAQSRTPLQQRQERVLTLHAANARLQRSRLKAFEDSVKIVHNRLDTLQVGKLRILVQAPFRDRTEAAARIAAARLDSVAGSAVAKLSTSAIIVQSLRGHLDSVEVSTSGLVDGLWTSGPLNDSSLAVWIGDRAIGLLHFSFGPAFASWLSTSATFRPDTVNTGVWTRLRLEMVSSPSFIAHRCYDGDMRACSLGLGLTRAADPVTQWLDADGRRRLATARLAGYRRRTPAATRCEAGDDTACAEYLRTQGVDFPIDAAGRFALAQVAVQMGGRQGYERLLNATGSHGDRIAAAAGVPLDSVLGVWRSRVRDTAAPTTMVTPGLAAASLAWIVLCAGLSLRSSRWR